MDAVIGFRRAIPEDLNFLLELRIASMHQHLVNAGIVMTEQQHRMRVDEFYHQSQLILKNRHPIGLIKLASLTESLHIRQFQILPKFQGVGIGSMVLDLVKKKALAVDLPITLNVLLTNPAKQLYQRNGFVSEDYNEIECKMIWHKKTAKKNV